MAKHDIIVGLDIGSTVIRTVVGQRRGDEGGPHILGIGVAPTQGIVKGAVVDVDETVSAISASLEDAERITGITIEHAIVAIDGAHIQSQQSKGVIAVSRPDGEIIEDDVFRVIEAAQAVNLPSSQELLHVIPKNFTVDEQSGIKDPVGMNGIRLEVEATIVGGQTSHIKNLTKCIERTGLHISELVLAPLAASAAAVTRRQKELGCVLVDIGGASTGVATFMDGDLMQVGVLPIGSSHITNDIAIGLRTSIDVAEKVKLEYGVATPNDIDSSEEVNLMKIDPNQDGMISRHHIAEIIEARYAEIFEMIDEKLGEVELSGKLPAGAIITGGGAKLPGIVDVAKEELRLPAQIGFPSDLPVSIKKIDDPSYATGIGLVLWGADAKARIGDYGMSESVPAGQGMGDTVGRMKDWLKAFMP